MFCFLIFKSQPTSVYVHRLTDKHSVYADKATADISPLGVRMPSLTPHPPSPPLWGSNSIFHSAARAQWGWVGEGIADTGVVCQKKYKSRKLRIGHFFSLRVQMHTYPPAVALRLVSLVPSFQPSECRTASCVFRNRSPLVFPSLCTGLNLFFFSVLLCFGTDI